MKNMEFHITHRALCIIFLVLISMQLIAALPFQDVSNAPSSVQIFLQKVQLFFTFNQYAKAQQAVVHARQLLGTAFSLVEQEKFAAAEQTLHDASYFTELAAGAIISFSSANTETELAQFLTIEDAVQEYEMNLTQFEDDMELRTTNTTMTEHFFPSIESKPVEEVKRIVGIDTRKLSTSLSNKRKKIIIKLKAEHGLNDMGARSYVANKEQEYGFAAKKKERLEVMRELTKSYIQQARARLEIVHDENFNTDDLSGYLELIGKELEPMSYDIDTVVIEKSRVFALSVLLEQDKHRFEKEIVEEAQQELHELQILKGELPEAGRQASSGNKKAPLKTIA